MLPLQQTIIQPQKWSALLPLALSSIIFFSAYKSGTVFLYFVGGFTVLLSLLLLWFLHQTKIILNDHGITMQTKVSTREFLWKDITNTYVKVQPLGRKRTDYWHFDTADARNLAFATSQYAKADLKTIATAVIDKCGHARIDKKVIHLAQ